MPSCVARPINGLRSFRSSGLGNFLIASYLASSGFIPLSEMMWPAKCILFPICSFFFEIVIFALQHLFKTALTLSSNSDMDVAQMIVSSTIFLAHGSPCMIMSDWQHHSSDDVFSPICALKYLNFPWGSRNVLIIELSWFSPNWKYPCTGSRAAKYFASLGTACRISVVCENKCTGRLTCLSLIHI